MKKTVAQIYFFLILITAVFIAFAAMNLRVSVDQRRLSGGVQQVLRYDRVWIKDYTKPAEGYNEITFKVSELKNLDESTDINIYLVHQYLRAYVGRELVYSVEPSPENLFGKTLGCSWASFPIYDSDLDKEIRLEITPSYAYLKDTVPAIFSGDKWVLFRGRIKSNLLVIWLCLLEILIGFFFVAWTFYVHRKNIEESSLMYLGMFSVLVGIWKLTDVDVASLVFGNTIVLSFMTLISLMLLLIPFTLYMDTLFDSAPKWLSPIISLLIECSYVVLYIFEITGMSDFREGLFVTHIEMFLVILTGIICCVLEIRINGLSQKLKLSLICVFLCFLGTLIDMAVYYISSDHLLVTCYGTMGFVFYIIILGMRTVIENYNFIEKGKKALRYQEMAFNDEMTGVYSRTAYSDYIHSLSGDYKGIMVVMCDLNNLKFCNDNFGHEAGDCYIKEGADILKRVFADKGKCFRIGGDEFCIMAEGMSYEECAEAMERIDELERIFNESAAASFTMALACGYSMFDEVLDYDISDTVRRADQYMYKNKIAKKERKG